jgi:hypothetical protein
MSKKGVIVAMVCSLVIMWAIAQQTQTSPSESEPQIETKVSESSKYGRHARTTEVFHGKVLLSRKVEISGEDGKLKSVSTKLYRDGELIFFSTYFADANRTIRGYYHQDKVVMNEGDEDGDGFFETMILFDAKEQPVEAFSKTKDGTVTQFSKEKLAELRKSFSKFQE